MKAREGLETRSGNEPGEDLGMRLGKAWERGWGRHGNEAVDTHFQLQNWAWSPRLTEILLHHH